MAELAIKGHPTRGKEVIEILEMMGGTNDYFKHNGKIENFYYYIGNNNHIYQCGLPSEMKCFTLEEFLEKYPYKVGDKVTLDNKLCSIIWICWECNNVYYQVQGIGDVFTKKVTAEKLKPYKEETMYKIIEKTTKFLVAFCYIKI